MERQAWFGGRVLACASVLGILLGPAAVQAQPGATPVAAAPDLTAVKAQYDRGRAKFDTYDYAGAVEEWTDVYAKLGDTPTEREIKNNLVYNIATAQERAYELDHDVTRLRQAVVLLRKYVAEYKTLRQATPEARAELAPVEARVAELEQRIANVEAAQAAPPPVASLELEGAAGEPEPAPRAAVVNKRRAVRDLLRYDPDLGAQYRLGRGMIIGGAVALGVGGLFAISVLPYIAASPDDIGKPGLAVPTAIGVAGILGGSLLLAFGTPMRRRAIEEARARVAWTPVVSPREAGFAMQVRF